MKLFTATTLTLFSCVLFFWGCTQNDFASSSVKRTYDKKTRADLAAELNFEMTKDPETNTVPRHELWPIIEQLRIQKRSKGKAAISNINWSERGPNNVGGRTRAILFDPNDPNKQRVFAGSVGGGLWVCEDIYAASPTWTIVDDFLSNMAITSLAFNPAGTDTMYMGTGEGYYNADAIRGDGIFKSTDGGTSWTQLSNSTNYNYIQRIVIDSIGNIYAATRSYGVVKSTDGGDSWSAVLNSSGTPTTNRVADLELASNGDLYAAFGIFSSDGVYKSTNGGSTWTKVYTASSEQRIELACAPSNSDVVYMVTQNSSTRNANAVRVSTNGGSSWSAVSNPNDAVGGTNFCRQQAWYDISLVVDPNDASNAYMGGIDLYKTTNSGSSWTQVSHWYGGGGYPEVHADQHTAIYAPNSSDSMLFGNDGGVYVSENATNSSPTISHIVNNYNVTQFYSGAIHPTATENFYLAGSQDNGSHKFSSAGINSTVEVTGGDGAFVHIDQDNPDYQFTSYVYNQYRRSTNGGVTFSSLNFSSSAGKFINPTDYDSDAEIMYCSWNNGQFMRWPNARTAASYSTVTFGTASTGEPSTLFADPNTSNRIYIGTDNGEIWKIDNASGTITDTDITSGSMPSGYVSCITVEDGDANHILVTFSNYSVNSVWESTDGGSSWNSVEGNLPNMPVRWAIFSPIGGDSALLATELGVWSTDNLNGGSTVWAASNTGLSNVRTDMLQIRPSDSTVIAITHGRGLYSYSFSTNVSADFTADRSTAIPCETVNFTDASIGATSWAWDFNNDGTVDDSSKNPSWSYNEGGFKTVKLTINGSVSETKTSYITVLPKLGTPYNTSDGGDFESNAWHFASEATIGTNLWERGTPTNQLTTLNSNSNGWKTDLDADCPDESITCHLYTPIFNLTNSGTYTLSFRKSMEIYYSSTPYGVYMEYSTDDGGSWSKLGVYNDANGTNWYNKNTIDASVIADQVGWHGNFTNQLTDLDISSLAGNSSVRFRFTFTSNSIWSSAGFVDGFMIDDFALSGPSNDPSPWEVETDLNASATADLGPNETVNFISSNCKIIATIENLSSHDYGSTTVSIDAAGSGAKNFATNTLASKQIFEKTIRIIPTTNNSSGNVKITTYYTSTEGSGWKSATGQNYKDLNQLKTPGSISTAVKSAAVLGSTPTIDSNYNGGDISLAATFNNGFSGVGAGLDGPSGPVPVQLLSFTGQRLDGLNLLKWITASEVNSDYFQLERLEDGEFKSIAKIAAAGNSQAILHYSYHDDDPESLAKEVVYYRLKEVDMDGSYEYSQVIMISTKTDFYSFSTYPKPATDYLKLNFDRSLDRAIDIKIISLSGQVVLQKQSLVSDQRIDLSTLESGTYFISIYRGAEVVDRKKILVLR